MTKDKRQKTKDNMTSLLIVESPAKCQKIQSYLGAGWRVIASLGHIRGLAQNLDFLEANFEPTYEWLKEKAKAIKHLKEAAQQADTIYLAADRDMEGEQIAYSVCLLLKLNPKIAHRVTFTEITEKAVRAAIAHPTTLDMHRVHTQQARAMLDLLLGFTMSPLLWHHVARGLSAGRCQVPSLRLVVEREDSIRAFQAVSSWQLRSTFVLQLPSFALAFAFSAIMADELEDEESAQNYMESIHHCLHASIVTNTVKPWTAASPPPLITSTLQQQASALYGMNPKWTMQAAQRLYEAGHITYMRTDKAVLSEEAKQQAVTFVEQTYGSTFVAMDGNQKDKKKNQDAIKQQEAHEAIRPTHIEKTQLDDIDANEKKLYRLIWQRTVQSVMAAARGETCTVRLQLEGDTEFTWVSQCKRTTFEGWKCVDNHVLLASLEGQSEDQDQDQKEDSDAFGTMTSLKPGTMVQWTTITAQPKETRAQGRYTEATLVRELERHGIGRPSTFASLLTVIQEKNYVECVDIPPTSVKVKTYTLTPKTWPPATKEQMVKVGAEKRKLVPTDLGRSVLAFLLKHFDDMFAYEFTSRMEKELDAIAEGKVNWKQLVQQTWAQYEGRYHHLMQKDSQGSQESVLQKTVHPKVHEWAHGLKAVQTKKGPLLLIEGATKEDTQFLGWPKGIAFEDMTEQKAVQFQQAQAEQQKPVGEWDGHSVQKKSGKFGTYLQAEDGISIPFVPDERWTTTMERFNAKKDSVIAPLQTFKNYVVRTGQYGPYIIKTSVKKAVFVSVPKGIDVARLTEKDVEGIYVTGLEAKKKFKKP